MERPTPAQIQYMLEHVTDDKRPNLIAASTVSIALPFIFVFLRFLARRRRKAPLLADDWWILAALVINTGYDTASFIAIRYGQGRHEILITNPSAYAQTVIASQVIYCFTIAPIKFSVLFLYNRLFPAQKLHITCLAVGAIVLVYSIGQAIGFLLQCIPLSSLWTGAPAKCVNENALFSGTAILNVITDFIILCLPVPYLWNLHISRIQRIQLFAIFALGGCVLIISIVRTAIANTALPYDRSWGNTNTAIWSVLEPCIGIVSACLPTLRPIFYKDIRSRTNDSDNYTSDYHRSNNTIKLSQRAEQSRGFTLMTNNVETGSEDGKSFEHLSDNGHGNGHGNGGQGLPKTSVT